MSYYKKENIPIYLAISILLALAFTLPVALAENAGRNLICSDQEVVGFELCGAEDGTSFFYDFINTTSGLIFAATVEEWEVRISNATSTSIVYTECFPKVCDEICINSPCRGSVSYCLNNTCTTNNNPCYCNTTNVEITYSVCDGFGNCGNSSSNQVVQVLMRNVFDAAFSDIGLDPACVHALNAPELIITCDADSVLQISKEDWSIFSQTSGRVLRLQLPSSVIKTSGTFFVFSVDAEGSHLVDSFYYNYDYSVPIDNCPTSDCLLCMSTIDNFNCQSSTMKFAIVSTLIIITVLMLSMFSWVLYFLVISCNLLYKSFMTLFWLMKKTTNMGKAGYQKVGEMWNKADETGSDTTEELKEVKTESKTDLERGSVKLPRRARMSTVAKAAVLGGMINATGADGACVGGITLNSVGTVCTRDAFTENCTYTNMDILASIPYSGASACFTFYNQDNSSVMGNMTIEYTEQIQYCNLVNQYFTSNWRGNFESHRSCYTPSNWCGGTCDRMSPSDATCSGRCSNADVIGWPGITKCARTCGCAGCNCFYCTSACLPYRFSVTPLAPYYSVSIPPTCEYRVLSKICYNDECYTTTRFRSSDVVNVGNFSVSIIGSFPAPLATIGTKKVCNEGQNYYLCDAANLNAMISAIPGDIQAASLQNLTTRNPNSFKFASDIATVNVGQTSATATFKTVGVSIPMFKMPYLYNSRIWESDGNFLFANETQTSSSLFRISSVRPVTFSRKIDLICPKMTLISVSGCYSCPIGANILVTAKSDCLPGLASLTQDHPNVSLSSQSLSLSSSVQNYSINFFTGTKSIDFNLVIAANGGSDSVRIQATLLSYSEVTGENTTSITSGDSEDDWAKFKNFYNDKLFGNWWRGLLSGIAHLFYTIVLFLIVAWIATKFASKAVKKAV